MLAQSLHDHAANVWMRILPAQRKMIEALNRKQRMNGSRLLPSFVQSKTLSWRALVSS